MKRLFLCGIIVIFLVYLAPLGLQYYKNDTLQEESLHTVQNVQLTEESQESQGEAKEDAKTKENVTKKPSSVNKGQTNITVSVDGKIREMDLETYVAGA